MTSADKKEARRKELALRCRKVRLFIAANPGLTSYQISKALGCGVEHPLRKMCGMKIVTFTQSIEMDGRRPAKWFVVPQ
jgi:hypothetical protein